MAERAPEATELVYGPGHSWAPIFLAGGLAGVLAGIFVWFPYGVIGGVVAIVALIALLRESFAEAERLPRHQQPTRAVIPPVSQRPADRS